MKRTISAMVGQGSVNHNSRKFHAKNTDPERSHLNITYCQENIKAVYHELFDEALERYNAKQTRADRRIEDYYEKIRSGKQEKPFHEIILQVGNRDDMSADSEEGQLAAAFRRIAAHMKPESILLFDMNTEYKFREVLGQKVFGAAEEAAAYIWENDYDEEEKINEYYVSFFIAQENGLYERVEEYHYERAYATEEIEQALQAAGLALLEVTDGYCFAPPQEKSERLLFVAKLK